MSKRRQEVGVLRPRRGNHAAQLHVTQCPCDGVGQTAEGRGGRQRSPRNGEERSGMEVTNSKGRGVKEWREAAKSKERRGMKWNRGSEFKGKESKRRGVEGGKGRGKRSEEMRRNGKQGKGRQEWNGGKIREKRKNKRGRNKGK